MYSALGQAIVPMRLIVSLLMMLLQLLKKLKPNKNDGASEMVSEHLIYSCRRLFVHLSVLYITMLRHGLTADGMLNGTMVPIPKGRWANLSSSDNFRTITFSSILCKLLDVIILTKEEAHLCTSNLQFGFKQESSTSLCTAMVQTLFLTMYIMVVMFMG